MKFLKIEYEPAVETKFDDRLGLQYHGTRLPYSPVCTLWIDLKIPFSAKRFAFFCRSDVLSFGIFD